MVVPLSYVVWIQENVGLVLQATLLLL